MTMKLVVMVAMVVLTLLAVAQVLMRPSFVALAVKCVQWLYYCLALTTM